jgi:hypothetical protein
MDFMHDGLEAGHAYRLFNVINAFNREGLGIEFVSNTYIQRRNPQQNAYVERHYIAPFAMTGLGDTCSVRLPGCRNTPTHWLWIYLQS